MVLRLVMKKILGHLESRVKGIVEEQDIKKMLHWFNSNFKDGVSADEFRLLYHKHVLADKNRRSSHIDIANCIFCPSRKLPFHPMYISIYAIGIIRGPIKPCINQLILAIFAYQTRPHHTTPGHITKRPVCHLDFYRVPVVIDHADQ